ncbi:MAG: SDR family oxidoreductase [Candidatus Dormiibacterota bacterium]
MSDRIIAVTGATGNIGSRVARQLAAKGSRQILVVRDPSRAPKLDNAEIRQASGYINGNQMRAAFEGSHTVFLISGSESAIRVAEHITAVNAAVAAGVERIVYLSYFDAAEDSIFTFARDHHATEQHIRTTGIPFTFLRMNMFMDFVPSMVSVDGVISGPASDGRAAAVARDDIADAAVAVLTSDAHEGTIYDLTGREAFSLADAAALMSRVSGKRITFHNETVEEAYASRVVYNAPDWEVAGCVTTYTAIAAGQLERVSDDVRRLTGHEPLTLAEYLEAHPGSLDHVVNGERATRPI